MPYKNLPYSLLETGNIEKMCILSINGEGKIVATSPIGEQYPCDVLQTSTFPLTYNTGDEVFVLFLNRKEKTPRGIIIGKIGAARTSAENVTIEAQETLSLKCGKASITLRKDGKVRIKGQEIVSHAQISNRVKGGSITLN